MDLWVHSHSAYCHMLTCICHRAYGIDYLASVKLTPRKCRRGLNNAKKLLIKDNMKYLDLPTEKLAQKSKIIMKIIWTMDLR